MFSISLANNQALTTSVKQLLKTQSTAAQAF